MNSIAFENQIAEYKKEVIKVMKEKGASDMQIRLVRDGSVRYAIINKRKPEDLAWAIMQ